MRKLHNPKFNKINYLIFEKIYQLNLKIMKSKWIEKWVWFLIKIELFYIDGKCKKTGLCCSKLMLFNKGVQIKSNKENHYKMFIPTETKRGVEFSCKKFNKESKQCSDYKNRPQLCKDYPYSSFLNFDWIRQGCGYQLKYKGQLKLVNNQLQKKVNKTKILNNIEVK